MFQKEYSDKFMANKLPIEPGRYGKTEAEFLQRCQNYYGLYASNQACFGFGGVSGGGINFKELRDYGAGLMSPNKYRDMLDPLKRSKRNKDKYFRRWNISWRVNPTLPKHVDRMKTRFREVVLTPTVVATDAASVEAKEFIVAKMKLLADSRMQAYSQATGSPLPGAEAVRGMSADDISTYYEMGGIALPPELAMKDGIDDMMKLSDWNSILPMMLDDKIKLGALCGHVFSQSNRLKVEYIDPACYFRRPSEYPDGRDSDFKAFIKRRRISEIRQYIKDEAVLEKIAKRYSWSPMKDDLGRRIDYDRSGSLMRSRYDDTSVEEMTLYFVDTQVECYATGRHKRGAYVFEPISPDTKFEERHQREKVEIPVQYLFKCRWIVGTDCVYDFGVADTIVRDGQPGSKEVVFPIFDHISQEPSLIERCVGFEDDKQLATFKIRNLIKKLPPGPRMWIDKTGLKNTVNMGDEEFSWLDNLENYASTGIGVFEREGSYDMPGVEGNAMRNGIITFVQSGIMEDINILRGEIKEAEENIRQATGQNPLEDGMGQPDMLKHTAESMTSGMNAALAPHIEDFIASFEKMCYIACQKWRLMVLNGDIMVGNEKKTILTKELFHRDWNVSIRIDNARSRDILLQDLVQNKASIPPEGYYEIYNTIMNGDLKKAQILLTKATAMAKELEHQRMLEIQKAQAQGNMEAGIATEKEKANTSVVEMSNAMKLEEFKAKLAEEKAKNDQKRAIEMERLRADLSYKKDVTIAGIQAPVRQGA